MDGDSSEGGGKCPVMHGGLEKNAVVLEMSNQIWWPNHLNLKILNKNSALCDPMGEGFDYAAEFKSLDLDAVKQGSAVGDKERGAGVDARARKPLFPFRSDPVVLLPIMIVLISDHDLR